MIREPLDDQLSDEHLRSHRASQGFRRVHRMQLLPPIITPECLLERIKLTRG